jgi:hypothetical protein
MICSKCGQVMVKLEDGTYDCGCYWEPTQEDPDYPRLEKEMGEWT